jgi:hypothetical protein
MPLVVPLFAVAFNALLWLARVSLSPIVRARVGVVAGWCVALVAPIALLALATRIEKNRREAFLVVAVISLGAAGLVTGV